MRRTLFALLALTLLGCPRDEITLKIELEAGAMRRSVAARRVDGSKRMAMEPPLVDGLEATYGGPLPDADAEGWVRLSKRLTAEALRTSWPQDVGGEGQLLHYAGVLGEVTYYAELLRGGVDLHQQVTRRAAHVEAALTFFEAYLRVQLGAQPGYDKLSAFLLGPFKQDLQDLAITLWASNHIDTLRPFDDIKAQREARSEALATAAIQLIIKRGYLPPEQLPQLISALSHPSEARQRAGLERLLMSWMTHKVGLDPAGPLALAVMKMVQNPKATEASLKAWGKAAGIDLDAQAKALIEPLLLEVHIGDPDALKLEIASPHAPLETNGVYEGGVVRWEGVLPTREGMEGRPPLSCFAHWVTPDEALQTKAFGGVKLEGEALREIIIWELGLSLEARAAWRAALEAGIKEEGALLNLALPGEPPPSKVKQHPLHKLIRALYPPKKKIKKARK